MAKSRLDWLELISYSANPTDTNSGFRGLAVVGTSLMYWNGSTWTNVTGGGGGVPTWEQIFAVDQVFNLTATGWTINYTGADSAVALTITSGATGSGAVLQLTQSGSGGDINGTSSTWSVTKAGVATFAGVSISGTSTAIATTGAAVWTLLDNSTTSLRIGAAGATAMLTFDTSNGAELVKFGNGLSMTDGNATFISTSNTVSNVLVTNNTLTTFGGNASSAGMVVLRSTSLTSGALLQLQLAEGTISGGWYLVCRDSTAPANSLTIGKFGATVITGSATGINLFTITAGDMLMSDGSITVTDADDAATLSITNNTATTANVFLFTGSGVHTGTGASSFFNVTQSGSTTGTVATVIANGLTTGNALVVTSSGVLATTGNLVSLVASGLTTGTALNLGTLVALTTGVGIKIAHTTSVIADTGSLVRISSSSIDTGGATNGTLLDVQTTAQVAGSVIKFVGAAMTTGILLDLSTTTGMTSGSVIRAVTTTAGAIATNGVFSFNASGAFTSGASTVGAFHVAGALTVSGTIMSILGGAQTTGIALNITDPSTGMTSGSLLRVISATTGAVATNGIVSFQASGAFTSTTIGAVNVIISGAVAGTGMAIQMSATNQTTGIGFRVDQSNTTTGYTGNLVQITGSSTTGQASTLAVAGVHTTVGNVVAITNASASQTGAFLLNVTQSVTTTGFTGSVVNITGSHTTGGDSLRITDVTTTTGNAISVISNALVAGTSTAVLVAHTTSVLGAGNSLVRISSTGVDTGTTTGVLFDLSTTSAAGSTQIMLTDSSANASARIGILSKITNAAAVLAVPIQTSNVAVNNSKFTKHIVLTDGTKTSTIWLSQDATSPNTVLSGIVGDICINGPSGRSFYCTGTTNWTASNA